MLSLLYSSTLTSIHDYRKNHSFVSKVFSINLLVVDHGEDREVVFKEGQGGKSLGEGQVGLRAASITNCIDVIQHFND